MQNHSSFSVCTGVLCNFSSTWVRSPHWASLSFVYITFGEFCQTVSFFPLLSGVVEGGGAFEKAE